MKRVKSVLIINVEANLDDHKKDEIEDLLGMLGAQVAATALPGVKVDYQVICSAPIGEDDPSLSEDNHNWIRTPNSSPKDNSELWNCTRCHSTFISSDGIKPTIDLLISYGQYHNLTCKRLQELKATQMVRIDHGHS